MLRGEAHGGAKLTEKEVIAIRERNAAGESQQELARTFGVTRAMIGLIVNRKKWRHIQ